MGELLIVNGTQIFDLPQFLESAVPRRLDPEGGGMWDIDTSSVPVYASSCLPAHQLNQSRLLGRSLQLAESATDRTLERSHGNA